MSEFVIPSSIDDRKKIESAVKEISNSKTRMEAENDNIKSIKERIKDEFGIETEYVNFLVTAWHGQKFEEMKQKSEDKTDLYEMIMSSDSVPINE